MNLAILQKDLRFLSGILQKKPFQVLVQVTNRCNMRCSFCDFWPNPAAKGQELTLSDYQRVAEELAELGCFLVSIEGGEPLIRKDLEGIVAAFAVHHIPALFTNGWYVDEARAHSLFDAGLVHASVSIDYADAAKHDDKRGLPDTTLRAWRAVDTFRRAAPRGGLQVHVMTVLMRSNQDEIEALLEQSREREVGHQFTLLATNGYRRGQSESDELPTPEALESYARLFERFPHVRFFRDYFESGARFLRGQRLPRCRAGLQSFNLDHVGNVSPCIERIDETVGNVRQVALGELHRRLLGKEAEIARCQRCYTACRGFSQALGDGASLASLRDLATRMRSS